MFTIIINIKGYVYIYFFLTLTSCFLIHDVQLILIASCFDGHFGHTPATVCPPPPHQFSSCCKERYTQETCNFVFFFLTGQKRKGEN